MYNIANKNGRKEITTNGSEKANILSKHFSSVFVKEPNWSWDLAGEEKPKIEKALKLKITRETIKNKLSKLSINKSPGPDKMHPRIFKEIASVLTEPLFMIYNLSIKTGKIPEAWRLASVTAIYKSKGDRHDPNDYRTVSLTSIACRIMESIIRDSILEYMKNNKLISEKQFGFLAGRSTILQLLKVIDEWTEILDRGGTIDVIYCDFQKAFDSVPHGRLMEVLRHYGIDGSVYTWIRDFLSGRKQEVHGDG